MTLDYRSLFSFGILGTAVACLSGTFAFGAAIQWGAPQTISAESDVLTSGTLEFAYNIGGSGTAGATVNGVAFTPFVVDFSFSPVTNGQLTLSTFHQFSQQSQTPIPLIGGTSNGSGSAPYALLTGAYKSLLSTSVKAYSGINEFLRLDANVSGLTIGRSYVIELWSNNSNSSTGLFSLDAPQVIVDPNSTNASGGVGQFLSGTFIADAVTQSFSFSTNFSSAPIEFSAIQLRSVAVPEMSTLALVSACALSLPVFTQRRRPACQLRSF